MTDALEDQLLKVTETMFRVGHKAAREKPEETADEAWIRVSADVEVSVSNAVEAGTEEAAKLAEERGVDIRVCSSCGESHHVELELLAEPEEQLGKLWTHSAVCPTTSAAVLVRFMDALPFTTAEEL